MLRPEWVPNLSPAFTVHMTWSTDLTSLHLSFLLWKYGVVLRIGKVPISTRQVLHKDNCYESIHSDNDDDSSGGGDDGGGDGGGGEDDDSDGATLSNSKILNRSQNLIH